MPIALQMGMETGSFNLSVIMMGWIGTAALAAHQAVATFTTIGFMLYYGIGSAITILVSNAKGAGEMNKVRSIANAGFHVIILLAVCQLFPRMFACGIFIWLCLSGWCYGYLVGISDWSDFGRSLVLFSFQV